MEQPAGTVTLLFSDIEGSTRLLDELGPKAYRDALAEHRRVMREAFARHGGYEVDYEGDAFFVAFSSASEAVAAALEAQAGLTGGPVRVRMGLHTGTPLLDPPKYVGMDVHLAARIMSAGHGGQVLLSQATCGLIEADVSELGEHRLKDMAGPVVLFQLGSERFPPLKTISNTNLPRPASSLVGREAEVAEVASLVRESRLVTLTGPGGTGKTRLAIEAAAELVGEFRAGVFWVGLATLRDPGLVVETVARTLGMKGDLVEHVGNRELLLLLDNFEQVVDAAPELSSLLRACPNLSMLVTSRELLRIDGESEYAVPPLASVEAVELFCARSGLEPSDEIRELCRRLDDMPLAVELAAARSSALSPARILDRLGGRLDLLKGGRDKDPRQQTLRATIAWSYELLEPDEKELFACLSVFEGGCTLEAAEEVAGADVDTLQSLVDKSLVRRTGERFWMLETIREFALELLDRLRSDLQLRRKHAAYFAEVGHQVSEGIHGVDQGQAIETLRAERDNIRSAVEWSMVAEPSLCVQLIAAVGRYWAQFVGSSEEGRRWLDAALGVGAEVDPQLTAQLRHGAATTAMHAGDYRSMRAHAEAALDLRRSTGSEEQVVDALYRLADANLLIGDWKRARDLFTEAIAAARAGHHRATLAAALGNLGYLLLSEGDGLGAIELCTESVALHRELGNRSGIAAGLCNLGLGSLLIDRLGEAAAWFREGLVMSVDIGQDGLHACCADGLGAIAFARGANELSARLIGHSEAVLARAGGVLQPLESALHERTLAGLRGRIGDGPLDAGLDAGRRLPDEDAIAQALSVD